MEPSVNWNKQTNKKGEANTFGEGLEFGTEIWLAKGAANAKKKKKKIYMRPEEVRERLYEPAL